MSEPIYLDNHATTPLDERVLKKMLPFFCEIYGNASSVDHLHGRRAKEAVGQSREVVAKNLGCRKAREIIFTSGATESNNLALIGAYRKFRDKGCHVISTAIEHPSVLDTLEYLKAEGAEITLLPVNKYGVVDVDVLKNTLRKETIIISVMFANNEIGTIQPIREIGEIAKSRGILFHTDAAQAVGHEDIKVYDLNVDLMSFSAHKFYGPKGIGGLFVRSYSPMIRLHPLSYGGGHERGMRAGTLNVPGIVGMSEALSLAVKEMKSENKRLQTLSEFIYKKLKVSFPNIKLNGHPEKRLKRNINVTIPKVENKALVHLLKDKLSFSTGSACSATKVEPSHVLKALGYNDNETFQTIRIGLGRFIKNGDEVSDILIEGIKQLTENCST